MKSYLAAVLLSLCPAYALSRLAQVLDATCLIGYFFVLSGTTFFLYRADKKKAEQNRWRTPEGTLHLLETLGGWQAAFVAQRVFSHKVSKRSYRIRFWSIALIHNYLAFDSLQHWHYAKKAIETITALLP